MFKLKCNSMIFLLKNFQNVIRVKEDSSGPSTAILMRRARLTSFSLLLEELFLFVSDLSIEAVPTTGRTRMMFSSLNMSGKIPV